MILWPYRTKGDQTKSKTGGGKRSNVGQLCTPLSDICHTDFLLFRDSRGLRLPHIWPCPFKVRSNLGAFTVDRNFYFSHCSFSFVVNSYCLNFVIIKEMKTSPKNTLRLDRCHVVLMSMSHDCVLTLQVKWRRQFYDILSSSCYE